MKKVKIILAGGARPNFVKIAPLYHHFLNCGSIDPVLVHTGQHSDWEMSGQFFKDLQIPDPDYFLHARHYSANTLIAGILTRFEKVIRKVEPDLVVVTGDVTSTLACAMAATHEKIPVAHVEAGLRSHDRTMPEELNRVLTDQLSQLLFVSETEAIHNLVKENIPLEKIFFTGNVMIDSLAYHLRHYSGLFFPGSFPSVPYILITIHRPSNVDLKENLLKVVSLIEQIAVLQKVVFPIHPRTMKKLAEFQLLERLQKIQGIDWKEPQGYHAFISLMRHASAVVTDSGGVQEETTYLQVPCLTFRETTERPVTVSQGTNLLISNLDPDTLVFQLNEILAGKSKKAVIPSLWDGHAAERITAVILDSFQKTTFRMV